MIKRAIHKILLLCSPW